MPSHHEPLNKGDDASAENNPRDGPDIGSNQRTPIVCVGASAGGLEAFKTLLAALPPDTGMAFVFIQHLDPLHVSLMGELLAGHTAMPVASAAEGVMIEPNHIYLIPPGVSLAVANGALHLSKPAERHGARLAFDFFLRSLADECGERAICVVLSGTGTDGSEGLMAIKKKGGFVIAQDPAEAGFDGMPKSAIKTGCVDLILPIAQIPAALVKRQKINRTHTTDIEPQTNEENEDRFSEILSLVRKKTGHDFSLYKTGTLKRRIERRMAIAGVTEIARYLEKLKAEPGEFNSLAQDLLINVTQFFRDASAFEALAGSVIPEIVAAQDLDLPLRMWVPGCSTGEEVYSLTMLFLEAIEASKRNIKLQVFASDVDSHSVTTARAGVYGHDIETQVSPERLARFFSREGDAFRVVRSLREAVVFTVQDLLADPPFSRLDFISCRNVLIYLRPEAQEQILSLFHFALRAGGVLFLGRSETNGKFGDRFEPINKKQRIYRHVTGSSTAEVAFPSRGSSRQPLWPSLAAPKKAAPRGNPAEIAQKLLMAAYAPVSVLVDGKYEALYFSGAADRYFQITPGEVSRNVLIMAREGLRPKLRSALESAKEAKEPILRGGAEVGQDAGKSSVKIAVQPVAGEDLFLVSFFDEPARPPQQLEASSDPEDTSRILQLEQELDGTRKDLFATIRDLEISNEDMRAINEEAQSINEEYQSTNEELETSKEELQALNEELTALNSQLQETLEQQRSTSSDMQNILNSSDVATLFLDTAFKIRFFTPAAKSLFGVASIDIGRPLVDLAQRFRDDELLSDASCVLSKLAPVRREIESHDGNWFIRSILPYRNDGGGVDGVVITFTRISEIKAAEQKIEAARAYAESIVATVMQPLVVLDWDLRIVSASASFFESFDVDPEKSIGKPISLGGKALTEPLAKFAATFETGDAIEGLELDLDLPELGPRTLLLSVREITAGLSGHRKLLVSIDDITDAKSKSVALATAKAEAERANMAKSRFLAAASHDLRQPLQTMRLLQGMLSDKVSGPVLQELVGRLDSTIGAMSSLLDKLLDINQLEAGVVRPKFTSFAIDDLITQLHGEFGLYAAAEGLAFRVVPSSLTVWSDPRLLEQILRNILSNAIKYTSKGKVLLGCRRSGGRARIEIWDTGSGIPETELKGIFKEFHQLENRNAKPAQGLGLGLAIAQRLSKLLEAPIDVRSRLGRGTVFSVEVPSMRAPRPGPILLEPAPQPRTNATNGASPATQYTILIVEDDSDIRDTLKLALEGQGYRTLAARDGVQALVIAAEGPRLDLIVADYNLPAQNGLLTIAKVEELLGRRLPVIMLTGDISASTLLEISSKGYAHLYKPADTQRLIGHIEALVDPQSRGEAARTVFVVDDDAEIRRTTQDMLEMRGYRVEIFTDGSSFLDAYSASFRGCLLADARMPGLGGLDLIERLADLQSSLPVIIITGYGDVAMAVAAMKAGAFDFLEKPVRQEELLAGIERALKFSAERIFYPLDQTSAFAKVKSLTARQREILDLIIAGTPSKNIAADLKISQRTVDNHRAAIMRKAGARSLAALIRIALAPS